MLGVSELLVERRMRVVPVSTIPTVVERILVDPNLIDWLIPLCKAVNTGYEFPW